MSHKQGFFKILYMNKIIKCFCIIITLTVFSKNGFAQEIKGYIFELTSSNPIWNASVKNMNTGEMVSSSQDGGFSIKGKINDYLMVSAIGYQTDTIFYYEDAVRRIYLNRDNKVLIIDEVLVKRLTDNRLSSEIARAQNEGKAVEASQYQGGLRVSPSRLFSKKAKEARANLKLLQEEQQIRQIDRVFTTQLISSITPLEKNEIPLFRDRFRPTLEFIETASPEDLKTYIADSYKKFKNLN